MNKGVHIGTASEHERTHSRMGKLAIAVGQVLALVIYLLLLEQYGFTLLYLDRDEHIIEASPYP